MGMQINSAIMENAVEFPQKIRIELQYDPAIPVQVTYLKKMKTSTKKDICTLMFITALFIKNNMGQTNRPLMNEESIRYR